MKLYAFRHVNVDRPDWAPLQSLALRLPAHPDLPAIHPADFMWMGELESLDGGPVMHLYKHTITRMYLNLDTDLRTYVFVDGDDNRPFFEATVYYRRLRGVAAALERLELREVGLDASPRIDPATDATPSNVVPLRRHSRRSGSVA